MVRLFLLNIIQFHNQPHNDHVKVIEGLVGNLYSW